MKKSPNYKFQNQEKVLVSGIPCRVEHIATDGRDQDYLKTHSFVRPDGMLTHGDGCWIANVFISRTKEKKSFSEMVKLSHTFQDTAREALRPLIDAISDLLAQGEHPHPLGQHWLAPDYSIAMYRGTGAGIHLSRSSPIHIWENEGIVGFDLLADYYTEDHPCGDFHDALSKGFEVRVPLDLVENFTQAKFKVWAEGEARRFSDATIAKAQEALKAAMALRVRSR